MKRIKYNVNKEKWNSYELSHFRWDVIDFIYNLKYLKRITKTHYKKWDEYKKIMLDHNLTIYMKGYSTSEYGEMQEDIKNFSPNIKYPTKLYFIDSLDYAIEALDYINNNHYYKKCWIVQEHKDNSYSWSE